MAREGALWYLARAGGDQTAATLIDVLRHDSDRALRASAAEALGKCGGAGAVGALVDALRSQDVTVVTCAARGLGMIGEPALYPLLNALRDRSLPWYARQSAARALGEIQSPLAIEALIGALPDSEAGHAAAGALAKLGGDQATELLLTLAMGRDGDPAVRFRALCALVDVDDPRALDALLAGMSADEEYEIRGGAARTLLWRLRAGTRDRSEPRVRAAFLRLFGDETASDFHRRVAAEALAETAVAETDEARAVAPFFDALGGPDNPARLEAVAGLSASGGPRAVEALLPLLDCEDDELRERAQLAIAVQRLPAACEAAEVAEQMLVYWLTPDLADESRFSLYAAVQRLAPELRSTVGAAWPSWHRRLAGVTAYCFAAQLRKLPGFASVAELAHRRFETVYPDLDPARRRRPWHHFLRRWRRS
jgi:HEAT repeat protein